MRDIPDIYRYAAIAVLLFSLLFILKGLGAGPSGFVTAPIASGSAKAEKSVLPAMALYPPVPEKMPDLNDGYIFNQERLFEEDDFTAAGSGGAGLGAAIDLNEVVYSGSLIVGDVRKALITYQEAVPAKPRATAGRRGVRPKKSRTQKTYRHKQLDAGEDFMGYKVAKIESDRIVFEKGGEKIEKFLYDGGKDRVVVKSAVRTGGPQTVAAEKTVQPAATAGRRQVPPPARSTVPVKPRRALTPSAARPGTSKTTPALPTRRSRRSQRFLELDPSALVPPPTAVSPQHQSEPR